MKKSAYAHCTLPGAKEVFNAVEKQAETDRLREELAELKAQLSEAASRMQGGLGDE